MPLILFVLFLVVPIVELTVIVQVSQGIGVLPTLLLLLVVSIAGAALVRREGTRAWRRFREALAELRLPTVEVVDGALVLLGGALMLTPGFVTDLVGLMLVVPLTRAAIARVVRGRVKMVTLGQEGRVGPRRREQSSGDGSTRQRSGRRGEDDQEPYDVEVVSIERNDPPERPSE